MNNLVMTAYDNECIVYLALEILKYLELEKEHMYIDVYYQTIVEIYEDYKLHDNTYVSLLDSINAYIESNKDKIMERLNDSFEGVF